ncbi:hypothetical protein [Kutzneria albida]|uniref:Secreted protein n=1 Tax=Kutzneria albida DSM 43870 TaxID=1449976 RepID=W5W8B6_9PSEU|nr:hypothetical protein [Kutzneria albida]AHH97383.1 hypothetical protein KALB_4019 [Kutzneria albida DSM 43870]
MSRTRGWILAVVAVTALASVAMAVITDIRALHADIDFLGPQGPSCTTIRATNCLPCELSTQATVWAVAALVLTCVTVALAWPRRRTRAAIAVLVAPVLLLGPLAVTATATAAADLSAYTTQITDLGALCQHR